MTKSQINSYTNLIKSSDYLQGIIIHFLMVLATMAQLLWQIIQLLGLEISMCTEMSPPTQGVANPLLECHSSGYFVHFSPWITVLVNLEVIKQHDKSNF